MTEIITAEGKTNYGAICAVTTMFLVCTAGLAIGILSIKRNSTSINQDNSTEIQNQTSLGYRNEENYTILEPPSPTTSLGNITDPPADIHI